MITLETITGTASKILGRETNAREIEKNKLLTALSDAKSELDTAVHNMNFVSEPMLIDHYAFKVKAAEVRYRYLLSQVRCMGIGSNEYVQNMYNNRYF